MPTINQKRVFENVMAQIESGKTVSVSRAMKEAGYKKNTYTKPANITRSKGWKELLNDIDDDAILAHVREIALSDDKRASLQAADMIWKLKDKYPAGKLKVQEYNDEVSRLQE